MTCPNNVGPYTPFTTVPLEIIEEIMNQLDWHSLLNIRQTCKFFNGMSKGRAVWISQYHQYVAQPMRSARLDEPLHSYSAQELEQLVLVRRSADIGWKCQNVKFSRNHWIRRKDVTATYLFPGSRWLLAGDQYGGMTVYDLDASTITERPLIPRDDWNEQQEIHHIVIEVDPPKQSPNLTFNMALSTAVHDASPLPLQIHFWRVTLTGHNTEARLIADHLRSIQVHDFGYIRGIAMRRNIFARIHDGFDWPYIEVFDWERTTSSAHCKAIIFPGVKTDAVRLLSGDRLLAFSREHMMIYSFVTLEGVEVTPPTFVPQITEPRWKLPFAGTRTDRGALSEGFSKETATYFVVKARNIHGLIIPHDEHQAPEFRLLMELEESDSWDCPTCAIGCEKAFIQHKDRSITRLSFSWETGPAEKLGLPPTSTCGIVISKDYPTTCNGVRIPHLDEETGCIVQDFKDGIRIIHTATLYRDNDELQNSFL